MSEKVTRPKLLFVYLQPTSFVRDDLDLLDEAYDVQTFHFDSNRFASKYGRLYGLFYYFVRQAVWLLREVPKADLIYGWFVDYHLFLPVLAARIWRIPMAVALGGAEGNTIPELGYGVFQSRWRAPLAAFIFRQASLLLPVTEALMYSENRYSSGTSVRANGVKAQLPGLDTPYRVIHFGFDPEAWPYGGDEREALVSTVAFIDNERTLRVKGIDLFIEAARLMPDVAFEAVGISEAMRRWIMERYTPPPNVKLLPPRRRDELPAAYGRASVYAQLSRTEGMPNVLCEAMLCGCIPVGSDVSGIPEIIGEAGITVHQADPERIAEAIRQALDGGAPERRNARRRIEERFSREGRRQGLLNTLASLRHL